MQDEPNTQHDVASKPSRGHLGKWAASLVNAARGHDQNALKVPHVRLSVRSAGALLSSQSGETSHG